jgi:hypothetical protein
MSNDIQFKVTVTKAVPRRWNDRKRGSRIYIFPKGESVWNQLFNRHARPHLVWRKRVMPVVLKRLGLPADTKFRWSTRAGCSCPCSPGFIMHSVVQYNKDSQYAAYCDIYVTVEGLPRIDEEKARSSDKAYLEFGSVAENAG